MTFPQTRRVIYTQKPLVEVICQLKFPPILLIDAELPAVFQEAIRSDYPVAQMGEVGQLPFPPALMKMLQNSVPAFAQPQTYQFLSEDSQWKLVIARDFIALSTIKYKRWEEFRAKLELALEAFVSTYTPSFFVRIGLRYR